MIHDTAQPQNRTTAGAITLANRGRRRGRVTRRIAGITCWAIGLIIILVASLIVHAHPGPWPGEVAFSQSVQSLNLAPGLLASLTFLASLIDPVAASIALVLWFAFLLTFGWIRQAAFLALTVGIGNAVDALIGDYVRRPRPTANLIHIEGIYHANSFPSGHSAQTVLYYGALLYLSFIEPVRTWRYRWLLLPFQIAGASIGVGHPAEAFANFGPAGMGIVMLLQGFFFAWRCPLHARLLWRSSRCRGPC